MERRYVSSTTELSGYDTLTSRKSHESDQLIFKPNQAYDSYLKIHKVLVGNKGGEYLEELGEVLEHEYMPQYLDAAGWAFAESSLARESLSTVSRVNLLIRAESCWRRALEAQESVNKVIYEDTSQYRLALNLAFAPLMKSIVAGNITASIREKTFCDVLALAQLSSVQRDLARQSGNIEAIGDHIGFGHECNALLTLLYLDDPRYVPLPSPTRSGTGYDYPDQTHDMIVINQHWGKVLKVIPVEIKAKASLSDIKRYKALIVRGKMHLSVTGKYTPEYTLDAFERCYESKGSSEDHAIVDHATTTLCDLLRSYQKGLILEAKDTKTKFHHKSEVSKAYPELSLYRAK